MIDLDKMEALANAAPSGQWEVWTSNSWRRVLSRQDGGNVRVIEPTVQRHDNHPDLMFGEGVREYLEGVTPETVLALIAEVRALREGAERYRELCAAAYQMAGAVNAPVRFMDALSDGACGEFETRGKIADLLPVLPDEAGTFLSDEGTEFMEDAERYRHLREPDNRDWLVNAFMTDGASELDAAVDQARGAK